MAGRRLLRPGSRGLRVSTGTRVLTVVVATTPVLLHRMRRELIGEGRLLAPTATAMYGLYAAHALTVAVAARHRSLPLPGGTTATSTALGAGAVAIGSGLIVAGMSRFVGPAQVSGTDSGELATGGIYRFSRNPQYTGYVLALTGLGVSRSSGAVVALAAGAGGVFAWWVPVEERALRSTFGPPYERYLARAPRWLGRPRRAGRR